MLDYVTTAIWCVVMFVFFYDLIGHRRFVQEKLTHHTDLLEKILKRLSADKPFFHETGPDAVLPWEERRTVKSRLIETALHEKFLDTDAYQLNAVSIRVRVIDPSFTGMEKSTRHDAVWELLKTLPEDVQRDISMLVLLAPGEEGRSSAYFEFENPLAFNVCVH